jgi:ABC-type branched-subunit amino acid transport system substrate-binding protein
MKAAALLALMLTLVTACEENKGKVPLPDASRNVPRNRYPATPIGDTSRSETDLRDVAYSQGANDTWVLIANSAPTSGAFAPYVAAMNEGISAYLRMVNAYGGIDGRRIVFTHYTDDEADPEKGRKALRGMVEDLQAFAIVGHYHSTVVAATVRDIKRYGIPAVNFVSGINELYATGAKTNADGYNLFPVQPLFRTEGRMMVGYAAGVFKAKTIGVMYTDDVAGENMFRGIIEQAALLSRVQVVVRQIPAISGDPGTGARAALSAAVLDLKRADPDCIIIGSLQYTLPAVIGELAAQGLHKTCITGYPNTSLPVSDAIVPVIDGNFDVYGLGWIDMYDTQAMGIFDRWIKPEYSANLYAMNGWIAAHFFCEGLRRIEGEDITWENYMAAMERGPINIPFGGSCNFSGGNRWGTQEMCLFRAIPASPDSPTGWEEVSPMNNINALLGWSW